MTDEEFEELQQRFSETLSEKSSSRGGNIENSWVTLPKVIVILVFVVTVLGGWGVKNWVENTSLRQQAHDDGLKQDVLKEMKTVLADGLNTFAVNQTAMIRQNLQDNMTWDDMIEWTKETRVLQRQTGHEHELADPRDVREAMKNLRKQISP